MKALVYDGPGKKSLEERAKPQLLEPTESPRRRSTTPGAGRDRPGSSTAPPRQNAKKKIYGAALDPTHHQRGCHPARRSNPSAPRQGIKTASASRKIGRESSTYQCVCFGPTRVVFSACSSRESAIGRPRSMHRGAPGRPDPSQDESRL